MKFKFTSANILQILVLSGALVGGFALLGPLKAEADRRAETVKNRIIGDLEESYDVTVRYESISPALLSVITVRSLTVEHRLGRFETERLRIFYNPFGSIRRNSTDPLGMISRITADNGSLDWLVEGESQVPPTGPSGDADPWMWLENKTLILTDFSARIRLDNGPQIAADRIELVARSSGDLVRYSFSGSLETELSDVAPTLGPVVADVESSGRFVPREAALNGRIDLLGARSNLAWIEPQSVDITVDRNRTIVRRVDDDKPLDLTLEYAEGLWGIEATAADLALRDIIVPSPGRSSLEPWFGTSVAGDIRLEGRREASELSYIADLEFVVPSGPLKGPIRGVLDASGSATTVVMQELALETEWGALAYSGTVDLAGIAPRGRLSVAVDDRFTGYPLDAVFDLTEDSGAISAEPIRFEAGGMVFHDFRFLVVDDDDRYVLSFLAVPGHPDEVSKRRLLVDAVLDAGEEPALRGFVAMEGFEASHILSLAGFTGIDGLAAMGATRMDLQASFNRRRESWAVSVDDAAVYSADEPDNRMTFRGIAENDRWSLDGFRIRWNDFVMDGRGYGSVGTSGGEGTGRLVIRDRVYPVEGQWSPDGSFSLLGDFGLSAVVGAPGPLGRAAEIQAQDVVVPLDDGVLALNLNLRGIANGGEWSMLIDQAQLSLSDRSERPDIAASFTGSVEDDRILLPAIVFDDGYSSLTGSGVFETSTLGRAMQGRLFLSDGIDETYELFAVREDDIWDVDVDVERARLNRFSPLRLAGRGNLTGRLTGSIDDPRMTIEVATEEGLLDGAPVSVQGSLEVRAGQMRVRDLRIDHQGLSVDRGLVLADLNRGSMRATAELSARYNQVPVESGFSLALDFDQALAFSELDRIASLDYRGVLATQPFLWDGVEHWPAFTFQFTKDEEVFRARTPDRRTLDMSYEYDSGVLSLASGSPLPISARGGGLIKDGNLNLSFPELDIDPVLINYVMIRDPILLQYHVVFQSGRFVGNMEVIGPAGDPDLNGILRAVDLKVDTPYTYADIQPASSDIRFEGNRITFERIDVPVGDGIVYGYGFMEIDAWSLTNFDMHYGGTATDRSPGVPVYYPLLGVYLDGLFIGDVHMTGDGQRFFLDADLTFPYLKASLGSPVVPVSQRKPGKYPRPVYLDFNFITGNNCTFYLPNEQLKIVRATAEPGRVVRLEYSNDPQTLSLVGDLPIKNGNIFYFDRDFQVTEGAMRFNETLSDFDPILEFRAETRVRDDQGDDVSVALVYDAPVKSDFNPRIETLPVRSESEILALFGQAVVPYGESGDSNVSTVLLATGGVFGQVGLVQPFEDVLRQGLNLDMVTIRTDIIENTLTEGLVRETETGSSTAPSGLGQFLDNTSLFAGKYIGDALFVSGSVSASYFEGRRMRSIFGGLEFQTSVSLEMETPFFNVGWSYNPDPLTDDPFIADNEISLRWQYSY